MPAEDSDERLMKAALNEARRAGGRTSPNPTVGAVLVIRDRIVARGYHHGRGKAHAEIDCLRRFKGRLPENAALFVTMEPCSTTGRTGPCTEAIINSGVKNVVIGSIDVNPLHHGRGINLLEQAGINVRTGVLADECTVLNEHFNKWIVTGAPFVVGKCGMSIDGRLTRRPGESRWITSPAARRHVQQLRAQVDAILVGGETVRQDDPRLTVRGIRGAKQPLRVVWTRTGKLPRKARLLQDEFKMRTLVYRDQELSAVLRDLGKREVTSVLIEGGGAVLGEALDRRMIDKVHIYVAPLFTGGPVLAFAGKGCAATAEGARLDRMSFRKIGSDVLVTGYPRYAESKRHT
jgi:diaminohydroxyphosphoribosylaminopyrimidine deaminase / 5-amino-6-(5-phosphoribosylamino)uracil reductase